MLPGAADRLLTLVEQQSAHRMRLERTVVESDVRRASWGLAAGFSLSLCFLGVSAFLISTGHETVGGVIGGLDIVALAGVFVYGTESRKRERLEKARWMSGAE